MREKEFDGRLEGMGGGVKAADAEEGEGTMLDEDDFSPCGSLRGDAQRIWTQAGLESHHPWHTPLSSL